MNKSKIEWCDYTINPVKGLCPVACSYCYARRMYKRFKWNESVRFDESFIPELSNLKQPSKIFVGSTMELFGEWVNPDWLRIIFQYAEWYPQHTFIFLTKRPENLIKWSPFPENCWVGVSATNFESYVQALLHLREIKAQVKFISFEPLLAKITDQHNQYNSEMMAHDLEFTGINWLIVGQQTPVRNETAVKMEWIAEIADAAVKAKIPLFLKNNLSIGADVEMQVRKLRQEVPVRGR